MGSSCKSTSFERSIMGPPEEGRSCVYYVLHSWFILVFPQQRGTRGTSRFTSSARNNKKSREEPGYMACCTYWKYEKDPLCFDPSICGIVPERREGWVVWRKLGDVVSTRHVFPSRDLILLRTSVLDHIEERVGNLNPVCARRRIPSNQFSSTVGFGPKSSPTGS